MKSKYLYILDAGHGGIDDHGRYVTAPSKMYKFPDGLTIYEGEINRRIMAKLIFLLESEDIRYKVVSDHVEDTDLTTRVLRVNKIAREERGLVLLISIHSNAGDGKGNEVFTSKGKTPSDGFAEVFCRHYMKSFPEWPFRSDKTDGDLDKESDFTVLKRSKCPAVLVESFFFDERDQAELLLSEKGQWRIAECLFNAIQEIEKTL